MTTATITPELAALASRAWHALSELHAQPHEVLDKLREDSECDDVKTLKLALYGAAADWVHEKFITDCHWTGTPLAVEYAIRSGEWGTITAAGWKNHAADLVRIIREWESGEGEAYQDRAHRWFAWCDRVDAALNLCRQIESLPA